MTKVEAFAEMGRETVEGCFAAGLYQPTRTRNRKLRRSARPPSFGLTQEYRGRR